MNGQELATAMQYGANVLFLVVNNGIYDTIRMHQAREYPARVYATALSNPDFAALARAYGAHGELVEETAQFAPAFERALAAGKPSLIELRIDLQAITTTTMLDDDGDCWQHFFMAGIGSVSPLCGVARRSPGITRARAGLPILAGTPG